MIDFLNRNPLLWVLLIGIVWLVIQTNRKKPTEVRQGYVSSDEVEEPIAELPSIPLSPRRMPEDLVSHCVETVVVIFDELQDTMPEADRDVVFDEIAAIAIGAYAFNWQIELDDQVSYFIGDTAQRLESERETRFGPGIEDDDVESAYDLYVEKGDEAFEDWRDFNEKRRNNPSYDGPFGSGDLAPEWQRLIDKARRLIEGRATP